MAFIREYAAMSGDPFRFRMPKRFKLPKAIRKFQPGKFALQHAGQIASFVPGPIGAAAGFARGMGLIAGDPGPKRKSASAGPKHKAQKKAEHRAKKASGHGGPSGHAKRRGHGFGHKLSAGLGALGHALTSDETGQALLQGVPIVGGALASIGHQADQELAGADAAPVSIPGLGVMAKGHARGLGLLGRHHRRTNPANVKALRRSIRRLEGFEKLVKSVHKAYPRLARAVHHAAPPARHHFGRKK